MIIATNPRAFGTIMKSPTWCIDSPNPLTICGRKNRMLLIRQTLLKYISAISTTVGLVSAARTDWVARRSMVFFSAASLSISQELSSAGSHFAWAGASCR